LSARDALERRPIAGLSALDALERRLIAGLSAPDALERRPIAGLSALGDVIATLNARLPVPLYDPLAPNFPPSGAFFAGLRP
jgi:hypothetical protein